MLNDTDALQEAIESDPHSQRDIAPARQPGTFEAGYSIRRGACGRAAKWNVETDR